MEKTIWFLNYGPYVESISMDKIIEETKEDGILKQLKCYIKKGYIPKKDRPLAAYRKILPYMTISDEGLIMKDEKIILPKSLWERAIQKAHQGAHPDMSGMKRRITSVWIYLDPCLTKGTL